MLPMLRQKRLKTVAAAIGLISLTAMPFAAYGAGLGRVTVLSALGEPLKAQLEVTGTPDELASAVARLASAEAFRLAGIEYTAVLPRLKFSPGVVGGAGKRFVEITTDFPINEPFVDMLVEFSWSSGRLVREYTFLLDPPELAAQRATAVAPVVSAAPAPSVAAEQRPAESAVPAPHAPVDRTPAVAAKAQPQATAPVDGYSVKRGDTLSSIALRHKPADVSLDQMLVAIFRNNADAFSGNMNRLHAGAILRVPDADTARSVEATQARREVVAQFADFESYRNRLAEQAGAGTARDVRGGQEASGKIAPRVSEKAAASADADKLSVSKTTKSADASRVGALEEDLVTRERALKEANTRIALLEKNIADMQKLAEMKAKSEPAKVEATKAPSPAPAKSAPPEVKAPEPKPAEIAKPAAPEKAAPVAEKPADSAAKATAPVPEKKPKKAAPPPPPPEPEADFMEDNAPLVFGGAALVTALLGFLGFSAMRKKRKTKDGETDTPLTQSSLAASSVFGSTPSVQPSTLGTITAEPSLSETQSSDVADAVDPLVEADTYLAFGKDVQAEERLLEALKATPTRLAIHVKLLEIYSARRSVMEFNTLAQDLNQQTRGRGQEWARAVALGHALDPNNPLYQSEEPAADLQATTIFTEPLVPRTPPPAVDVDLAAPQGADGGLDFDLGLGAAPAASATAEAAPAAEVDFDLDLGSDAPAGAASAAAGADAGSAPSLDIDFDLELPASAKAAVEAAPDIDLSAGEQSLDATLKLDVPPETVPAPAANAAGSSIDFDFDLSLPGQEAAPASAPEPSRDVADTAQFDAGMLSLELPAAAPAAAVEPMMPSLETATPAPVASIAPSEPVALAPSADDNPEAATKLELAAAYEEMGDRDGARELLEEVLTEGSAAQQAAARAKLEQLG